MFGNLLITITAIAIVGAVFEMLLPDSANKKYLRGAMALVFCYIFITGIITELNFDKVDINAGGSISQDYNFEQYVDDLRVSLQKSAIKEHLESKGYSGVHIEIYTRKEDNLLLIEKILLDKRNLVISNSFANINIIDKLKELVSEFCNIKTEKVEVYG